LKPSPHTALMNCSHCYSALTTQLKRTTSLGYQTFYCRDGIVNLTGTVQN
jgi:hypothetical protein